MCSNNRNGLMHTKAESGWAEMMQRCALSKPWSPDPLFSEHGPLFLQLDCKFPFLKISLLPAFPSTADVHAQVPGRADLRGALLLGGAAQSPVGQLMQTRDWSDSALGEPARWPQPVLTLVQLMLYSSSPMCLVWGPQLNMLYNDAYVGMLGEKHPAALGQPLSQVWSEIWPDLEPMVAQTLAGHAAHHQDAPFTIERRKNHPEQAWFSFSWVPAHDADGRIQGFVATLTETTASKHVEVERRDNERRASEAAAAIESERSLLDALLEAAPVGIVVANAAGKLVRVNAENRRLWGAHPLSEKVDDYVEWKGWWADGSARHGQQIKPEEWALARALRGEEAPRDIVQIETFGPAPVRRTILNCGAPVRNAEGEVMGSVIAQMDITDRVQSELAARENEAKFRNITNAMPQIVWSTLPDGFHDYYNQQWYDFTGVKVGSTDGEGWNNIFHPDDQLRAKARWIQSLGTGETYEIEYRLRHHSGEYRWVLGRALPLRNERQEIVRWMGTCTDIHERKMSQEALLQSDRRKDEFLAMLSHELRNPLAPIATAADMLASGQLKEADVQRLSRVIGRQAVHMTSLIDDLLDVSRVTRGLVALATEPVNMADVVAEAVEQVRPLLMGREHHLQTQLALAGATVLGEKKRLVQVLANLLGNAARYTPNGGQIKLRVSVSDDEVELTVCDNGIGMSAELVLRAFELFAQGERTADRSQGGLGIGLALVRSLVQLHGGKVTALSHGAGQGSEFKVVLPRLRLPTEATRPPPALVNGNDPVERPPMRLLVVDDNGDAADILGMFLEMLGYEVAVAYGSVQALALAQQVRPDVCLLDIGLPDINGYDLARQMRTLPGLERVALAAVTGYGQARDKQAAVDAGFDAHFVKPLDDAKLQAFLVAIDAARPA